MRLDNASIAIRPEEDLLLCCSRISMDCERAERIKALLQEDMDWTHLTQLALGHGVVPLLYRNLKLIHTQAIPSGALHELQKYSLTNAGRNIFLTEVLSTLLDLFEVHKIAAIPYKGPALAASIYGDIALRQFSDLDILIQKQDVLRASDLIASQGYRPHFQLNDVCAEPYLKSQNELSFTRHDGKVIVELQWEIVPRYFNVSIPSEYLWNDVEHCSRSGLGFRQISPEVELIILCIHGTKERWARLLWVCDVAEFIHVNRELDWDWVIELARTLGSLRMLLVGVFLAKDLLDAPLPEKVMEQLEVDPMARRLAGQANKRLFNGANDASGILKKSIFYLRARERMCDQIQYCLRLAATTTPRDWALFQLPKTFFPLYYLIRPIRLAGKYGLKVLRG